MASILDAGTAGEGFADNAMVLAQGIIFKKKKVRGERLIDCCYYCLCPKSLGSVTLNQGVWNSGLCWPGRILVRESSPALPWDAHAQEARLEAEEMVLRLDILT